jgi:hypothetical protein
VLVEPVKDRTYHVVDRTEKIRFAWKGPTPVDTYHVVIARDPGFDHVLYDAHVGTLELRYGELERGTYYWRVSSVAGGLEGAYSETERLNVVQDREPLLLEVHVSEKVRRSHSVRLTGRTEPGAKVFVRGRRIPVTATGSFEFTLELDPGSNVVVVRAEDQAGHVAYAALDKEDTFYLVDAEPSDSDYLFTLDADPQKSSLGREHFGFAVHRVKRGRGVVFGYRFYSNGRVTRIDDEAYRKVTVWLPSGAPGSPTEFDLADRARAVVMFSRGGSAWPENDCSGYVSSGALRVAFRGAGYAVAVHGQLKPHGNSDVRIGKGCTPQRVDLEFDSGESSFEQLTPWLGIAGSHPYDETSR